MQHRTVLMLTEWDFLVMQLSKARQVRSLLWSVVGTQSGAKRCFCLPRKS